MSHNLQKSLFLFFKAKNLVGLNGRIQDVGQKQSSSQRRQMLDTLYQTKNIKFHDNNQVLFSNDFMTDTQISKKEE